MSRPASVRRVFTGVWEAAVFSRRTSQVPSLSQARQEDVPALLLEDGGKHVAVKARVGEIQQLLRLLFPRREAQQALPV